MEKQSSHFDLVVIASSAGGLQALIQFFTAFGPDFPASFVVVQHLDPNRPSMLVEILSRNTHLAIKAAEEGSRLTPGVVYIAPPDHHVVINADHSISLTSGEREHHVRPSADVLFRSAAEHFKDRLLAVILTGTGTDGSSGVVAVKRMGGTIIAQDRDTSAYYGMPLAAIQTGSVDYIVSLADISNLVQSLVYEGASHDRTA